MIYGWAFFRWRLALHLSVDSAFLFAKQVAYESRFETSPVNCVKSPSLYHCPADLVYQATEVLQRAAKRASSSLLEHLEGSPCLVRGRLKGK